MMKKIYVLTKYDYPDMGESGVPIPIPKKTNLVIAASTNRKKLERYVEAIQKRNPQDPELFYIKELEDYDDSYLNNYPEEPIYQLQWDRSKKEFQTHVIRCVKNDCNCTHYFPKERIWVKQLSYPEEERFINKHHRCKCIPIGDSIISIYVRAIDKLNAIDNAKRLLQEYLKEDT